MKSLRRRLFLLLVAATGFVWLAAVAWIEIRTRNDIEHVLDARLREAARMVVSLIGSGAVAGTAGAIPSPDLRPELASYRQHLACQIWSLDGRLIGRSSDAPEANLSDNASGFSDRLIDGQSWRIYSIEDRAKGVRVLVGDRLGLRTRLVAGLIEGLVAPALFILPLLGVLIWMSIGRGLSPLSALAKELQSRDADDMRPISAGDAPQEVRPVAEALNGLFAKVEKARRHEREVTAFAAHELRTPLAGLKTHAQVAIAAADPELKERALRQILTSVDRTARLVRQLLALAKLEAGAEQGCKEELNAGQVIDEIVDALKGSSSATSVVTDPALRHLTLQADRELFTLALRNLHENAIFYTPAGGTVRWGAGAGGKSLFVEDDGPGIPEEELPLVTQRFFRGHKRTVSGSGLGLTIVDLALKRIGSKLILGNRLQGRGLRAEIVLQRADQG